MNLKFFCAEKFLEEHCNYDSNYITTAATNVRDFDECRRCADTCRSKCGTDQTCFRECLFECSSVC